VIDATLLHPLPYPNPAELVRIQDDLSGVGAHNIGISVPEWRDLQSSGIFQSVSVSGTGADVNLTGSAQPERLSYKHSRRVDRMPLVYGRRFAIDVKQAVDGVRRAAHRIFSSEDNIVGLLAELACEGEVLPPLRQHVRPVSSFSAQELAGGDGWIPSLPLLASQRLQVILNKWPALHSLLKLLGLSIRRESDGYKFDEIYKRSKWVKFDEIRLDSASPAGSPFRPYFVVHFLRVFSMRHPLRCIHG
jgi:hypothetical protein